MNGSQFLVITTLLCGFLSGGVSLAADGSSRQVATKIAEFNEEKEISSMDFSPDTHRLAAVEWTGSEVHIWKWQGDPVIEKRFSIAEGTALSTSQSGLQYSPDGTLLAMVQMAQRANDFGVVRIWDTRSGSLVHEIKEASRNGLKSSIAFSADGKFLMRSYDAARSAGDQFFVHDTKTWDVVWSLHTAPFIPKTLALSPNGKSVVLGGMSHGASNTSSDLVTLDLQNHGIERRMTAFAADQAPNLVLWSPDGARILAISIDGSQTPGAPSLTMLDASNGQKTDLESNAAAGVQSLVFAANGKYLIEGGEHLPVTIWNSMHTTKLQEIPIQPARLAVSRDGRYLAVARLSKVSVWQIN